MKKALFFLFCLMLLQQTHAQKPATVSENLFRILLANKAKLAGVNQLLLVFNEKDTSHHAVLIPFERKGGDWRIVFSPVKACIGKYGFAQQGGKTEGDGKTPTGLFDLGRLFSYEANVNTRLPYQQTTAEDKWIDDPASDAYNTYVKGNTDAKSFEKLLLNSIDYKYCMVIEYNTKPVVKGKGSAIFFHLADSVYTATAGCVAVQETDMKRLLTWFQANNRKAILMGSREALLSGIKN